MCVPDGAAASFESRPAQVCALSGIQLDDELLVYDRLHRAGITTVIIPKLNEKDPADVPEEAKQKLKFVPVENVDGVLAAALEKNGAAPASENKTA